LLCCDAPDGPPAINSSEETATPRIFIFWDKAPKDTEDFFTRGGIPLHWLYDFKGDNGKPTHSVYAAGTTARANDFMTAIIKILEDETDSYGELP
jgi:hypothetical protein